MNVFMASITKIVHLFRLSHWSKSVFVFLGVIYSGRTHYWVDAGIAALSFSLIASVVYVYNDIHDREKDRLHPKKCLRPLATEAISQNQAIVILCFLLVTGLGLGALVSIYLVIFQGFYLLINLAYNHYFKKIPVFDVFCIASGFMLRVLAGTIGIGIAISWWLILAATLVSLLIALGKRCLEKQLNLQDETRAVLKKYSTTILNNLVLFTAIMCFIFYAIYIIEVREDSRYFLITLPFAAMGLGRFVWLSRNELHNDDPITLCLTDWWSCLNLICFSFLTLVASFK